MFVKCFQHEPMNAEQKKAILERYAVKEHQLPRIQISDPVKFYKFQIITYIAVKYSKLLLFQQFVLQM